MLHSYRVIKLCLCIFTLVGVVEILKTVCR